MWVEQDTGEASAELPGRGRTVLVTGARGFVGEHLCEELVGDGWRVRALVRGVDPASHFGEEVVRGDVVTGEGLAEALAGADAVVHVAGLAHVSGRKKGSEAAFFRDVEGTRNLVREAIRQKVKHFVHISSIGAIGPQLDAKPLNEHTPPHPNTSYGRSKLESEKVVRELCDEAGMAYTILRPAVVYGPGMKGNPLRLFNHIARGWPVPVPAKENRRSFLNMKNLTAAIAAVLHAGFLNAGMYVVSDPDMISIANLVRLIAKGCRKRARIVRVPLWVIRAATQSATVGNFPLLTPWLQEIAQMTDSLCIAPDRLAVLLTERRLFRTAESVAEPQGGIRHHAERQKTTPVRFNPHRAAIPRLTASAEFRDLLRSPLVNT